MPEVIGDAYAGQRAMRQLVKKSTCVICLATMLHTIATGNMTPSFRVLEDGTIRPLYLYTVDADEFVVNKLLDRGKPVSHYHGGPMFRILSRLWRGAWVSWTRLIQLRSIAGL